MSICRRQINLTTTAPVPLNDDRKKEKKSLLVVSGRSRNHPKPPSLSRSPAKIIEPVNGASTWAFGNHKCTPYKGNFTKKAATVETTRISLNIESIVVGWTVEIKLN